MEAPMSAYKLRIKIGQHEFEAEGEESTVKAQFEEFKSIIAVPAHQEKPANNLPPAVTQNGHQPNPGNVSPPASTLLADRLNRIVRVEGKNPITLSALPRGEGREGDAVLVLLLAYKAFWQQDEMAGARLLDGLQRSGYNVERVDRVMDQFIEGSEPLIMRSGVRRGVRYRLTTRGYARATELAQELVENVAC
jgi:hypothetical protein